MTKAKDCVLLRVPAQTRYMVTVRLVAGSVAGRAGFNIEEVQDVQTAVSEACLMLLPAMAEEDMLEVELCPENGLCVAVRGRLTNRNEELSLEQEIGKYLLEEMMDEVLRRDEGDVGVYILEKRLRAEA